MLQVLLFNFSIFFTTKCTQPYTLCFKWLTDWPKNHNFRFYKLTIEHIFLIDGAGGPNSLTLDQYLHPKK